MLPIKKTKLYNFILIIFINDHSATLFVQRVMSKFIVLAPDSYFMTQRKRYFMWTFSGSSFQSFVRFDFRCSPLIWYLVKCNSWKYLSLERMSLYLVPNPVRIINVMWATKVNLVITWYRSITWFTMTSNIDLILSFVNLSFIQYHTSNHFKISRNS